ncbi:hypothetical protein MD484_g1610, partial [Candolleomyces efflorescens]
MSYLQWAAYHLWTLVLFTWSDFKTTLIPVSVLGIGTAEFNINNQAWSPEEDAKNKPWRPIPAGRISLRNAKILRWISVAYCCILSLYFQKAALIPSFLFTCFVFAYNYLGWDRNGFMKIFMLAYGYPMMALGAVLVAECPDPSTSLSEILDWKRHPELIAFAVVIATTVHAQDFQDVVGDREIGRNTVPMMFPVLSRVVLLFLVPLWTALIVVFSGPPMWLGALYYGLSLVVAVRCILYRNPKDDAWTNFFYSFLGMGGSTSQMFSLNSLVKGPLVEA